MHAAFVAGLRASIVAMLFVFIIGGTAAAWQAAATPERGCVEPAGTPGAGRATPIPQPLATPSVSTPIAVDRDTDYASLVDALEACAITVEDTGSVEQPFLQPESSTSLHLSGGGLTGPADVQVFEYADADSLNADASQIGPDGNPSQMMIHWIAPPHFFKSERLIVLYVGEDEAVVQLLTTILGPPFAGN